jgi:hypothetical protein
MRFYRLINYGTGWEDITDDKFAVSLTLQIIPFVWVIEKWIKRI